MKTFLVVTKDGERLIKGAKAGQVKQQVVNEYLKEVRVARPADYERINKEAGGLVIEEPKAD